MTEVTHWSFPSELQPVPSELAFDLDRALQSVVRLSSHIPEDGYTASMLGTERTGNGVVIRDDGLIVTIGYLITEAESIWITTHDNRVVQGHPLAYDFATGMGLVLPLGPLNAAHVTLGSAANAAVDDDVLVIGMAAAATRSRPRSSRAASSRAIGNTCSTSRSSRRRRTRSGAARRCSTARASHRHRVALRAGSRGRRSEEGQHVRADRRARADPRRPRQDPGVRHARRAPGSGCTRARTTSGSWSAASPKAVPAQQAGVARAISSWPSAGSASGPWPSSFAPYGISDLPEA
jgi:hypothetical protein